MPSSCSKVSRNGDEITSSMTASPVNRRGTRQARTPRSGAPESNKSDEKHHPRGPRRAARARAGARVGRRRPADRRGRAARRGVRRVGRRGSVGGVARAGGRGAGAGLRRGGRPEPRARGAGAPSARALAVRGGAQSEGANQAVGWFCRQQENECFARSRCPMVGVGCC